jgi:hypothetical protein
MILYFGVVDINENEKYINLCDNNYDYLNQLKYKNVMLFNDFRSELFPFLDDLKYSLELKAMIGKVKDNTSIIETLEFLNIEYEKS